MIFTIIFWLRLYHFLFAILATFTIVIRLIPDHIIEFFNIFFYDVKLSPHARLIHHILGADIVLCGLQTQANQMFDSL